MLKSLIVDDDAASIGIFKTILSRYGEFSSVSNGIDAINEFKNSLFAGSPYNLIILDVMMPGMDGYEVLQLIRSEKEAFNKYPPDYTKIIITTGLDDDRNRQIEKKLIKEYESFLLKTSDIHQEMLNQLRDFGFTEL